MPDPRHYFSLEVSAFSRLTPAMITPVTRKTPSIHVPTMGRTFIR